MSGWLRRASIWIRLALVCAALIGTSAPAPAIVHAEVAMFVASAEVLAATPAVGEIDEAVVATASDAGETAPAPEIAPTQALSGRTDGGSRRLFLLNCALLC